MTVNPFTYGNPISDPTRFFGRRHVVSQVYSRLRNIEFESSSLVGERRIGKTSLLSYLMHPDVRKTYGLDSNRYLFVYIDLQMLDQHTTPMRLWQRLLRQIARQCQNADIKQLLDRTREMETIDNFALEDLFDSIDEKDQYIVLLLDEFENVTENQNFGPAFFYGLRSLAIHHHLSLITSSRRELIELCHSEAIRSSPFFNIFANINVRLFTKNEALDFIFNSLIGTDVSFGTVDLDTLFRIAGYHPYFLQVACYFLFDAYSKKLAPDERIQFLSKGFKDEATPHLDDYWHNSYDQEKIVLTALALMQQQQRKIGGHTFNLKHLQELYTRSDQTLGHLEKRGFVVREMDTYLLFNSSFAEWIFDEITDTMHDNESYQDWLKSNKSTMERLSSKAINEMSEILPKISSNYRELIITWISDPKNLFMAMALLKSTLGFG